MTINLKMPDLTELKPKITVFGVGGAGGNAVNNMIRSELEGVDFVVANTDAQALTQSAAERTSRLGRRSPRAWRRLTPEVGRPRPKRRSRTDREHLAAQHGVHHRRHGRRHRHGRRPVIAQAARDRAS